MLSYLPKGFIQLLMISAVVTVIAAFVFGVIKVVKLVSNGTRLHKTYGILSAVCVLVMAASWFLNFGWLRFAFTLIPIPIVHVIVWFFAVNSAAAHVHKSKKLNTYIILSYITFLGTYLLLPDGGDIGAMYMFFGLIRNDVVTSICGELLQPLMLVANIVFLILARAESNELKKYKSKEIVVTNEEEER